MKSYKTAFFSSRRFFDWDRSPHDPERLLPLGGCPLIAIEITDEYLNSISGRGEAGSDSFRGRGREGNNDRNNFGKDRNNFGSDRNNFGSDRNNFGNDRNNFGSDRNNFGSDRNKSGGNRNNLSKENSGYESNNSPTSKDNSGYDRNSSGNRER